MAQLGKTQFLRQLVNGQEEFTTVPFGGNIPTGATEVTREQFGVGLKSRVEGIRSKALKNRVRIDESREGSPFQLLKQFEAGQGAFAEGFKAPGFERFQPDAPTPSEEFLKPEFKAQIAREKAAFAVTQKAAQVTPQEKLAKTFSKTARLGQVGPDGKPIFDVFDVAGKPVSLQQFQDLGLNVDFIPEKARPVATGLPTTITTPTSVESGTPSLPTPDAGNVQDAFVASAQSTLDTSRATLETRYKTELENLDKEIEESKTSIEDLTTLEEAGIEKVGDIMKPFREKLEAAERERLAINKNFQDNQILVDELGALLTEGNELIRQQKEITGLSAIRNPRIDKTISDVNARIGVIEAVMEARNGQINQAYKMIDRSINAINADKQDQLTYYSTLLDFYDNQKDDEGKKLVTLDTDKRTFLNAQIGLLENDLAQSQANAQNIKDLMTDPETASFMAKAGVTLNDTVEEINEKMARQSEFEGKTGGEEFTATEKKKLEQAGLGAASRQAQLNFLFGKDKGGVPGTKVFTKTNLPGSIRNSIIEDLTDKNYAETTGELTLSDLSNLYPEVNLEALRELHTEFYDFEALTTPADSQPAWWQRIFGAVK